MESSEAFSNFLLKQPVISRIIVTLVIIQIIYAFIMLICDVD